MKTSNRMRIQVLTFLEAIEYLLESPEKGTWRVLNKLTTKLGRRIVAMPSDAAVAARCLGYEFENAIHTLACENVDKHVSDDELLEILRYYLDSMDRLLRFYAGSVRIPADEID